MKDYLEKVINSKNAEIESVRAKIKTSESADEVRALGETLNALLTELQDAKDALAKVDENDDEGNDDSAAPDESASADENRSGFEPMKAIGGMEMANNKIENRSSENVRETMEYRQAFMNYIQRGQTSDILQYEKRDADAYGTTADLGVLIPTTIIQEIIKGVEKKYGQLYSRVRKLNLKGGVSFPIGSFSASFKRIAEGATVSARQDAGGVTSSVEFSYKIGEIRLARTLLQTVLSVPVFEEEFSKVIVEAYVKAMDKEIMVGTAANNECVGILTEAALGSSGRIPTANIITFTEAEMADWTEWQKKLFAKIPLGMRSERPQFVMTANTYEANIKTLKDANDRPLYNETFNPVDGSEICTFKGKEVVLVEDDILENFDDADNGEYFGMYWVPEKAYAINSNLEFSVVDYFDHETNAYIKKAIVINDGKVLDGQYIYLLKKSVAG